MATNTRKNVLRLFYWPFTPSNISQMKTGTTYTWVGKRLRAESSRRATWTGRANRIQTEHQQVESSNKRMTPKATVQPAMHNKATQKTHKTSVCTLLYGYHLDGNRPTLQTKKLRQSKATSLVNLEQTRLILKQLEQWDGGSVYKKKSFLPPLSNCLPHSRALEIKK